jgi:hypothetical protein
MVKKFKKKKELLEKSVIGVSVTFQEYEFNVVFIAYYTQEILQN